MTVYKTKHNAVIANLKQQRNSFRQRGIGVKA